MKKAFFIVVLAVAGTLGIWQVVLPAAAPVVPQTQVAHAAVSDFFPADDTGALLLDPANQQEVGSDRDSSGSCGVDTTACASSSRVYCKNPSNVTYQKGLRSPFGGFGKLVTLLEPFRFCHRGSRVVTGVWWHWDSDVTGLLSGFWRTAGGNSYYNYYNWRGRGSRSGVKVTVKAKFKACYLTPFLICNRTSYGYAIGYFHSDGSYYYPQRTPFVTTSAYGGGTTQPGENHCYTLSQCPRWSQGLGGFGDYNPS